MTEPIRTSSVEQAELDVADAVGRLMEFWGFKRAMGRVWTLLYLSPEALGAAEIAARLHMSAGAVSMTVAELLKWGTIHKSWKLGERKDYYEAETSVVRLVTRVFRERELTMIQQLGETLSAAEQSLRHSRERDERVSSFVRDRLRRLQRLAKAGEALLTALVAGSLVDTTPLLREGGTVVREASRDG